jgi:hypothetical protein
MVRIYGARRAAGRRVRKTKEALRGEGARLALQHGADHAGLRYCCWREPSTERAGTRNIGYGIGMPNADSGCRVRVRILARKATQVDNGNRCPSAQCYFCL